VGAFAAGTIARSVPALNKHQTKAALAKLAPQRGQLSQSLAKPFAR